MLSFLSIPILLVLPLLAAIIIHTPILSNNHIYIRRFASVFSIVYFFYSLLFYIFYIPQNLNNSCNFLSFSPQFVSSILILNSKMLNSLGIHIAFGVDNISILMIILTTLVFSLVLIGAKLYIKNNHKYFYSLVLLLESILIGLFSATDMFLFFILWELELIPMYLLISLWGNINAKKSAMKFVLYTFAGSLFILLGILFIYYANYAISGVLTADIAKINVNKINILIQLFVSVCFVIGFGVKIPLVPFHRWLADTHTNATTPVSIILAAVLLKLGLYGLLRFNVGLVPIGFTIIAPIIGMLAFVNIIYGAALAYNQLNIKRLIAYSSISQMGLILLGIVALNPIAMFGSVYHIISHGIVVLGLFFVVGIIKNKFKTVNFKKLSGIACLMPRLYGFSSIIAFAAIGVPFLSGFIGEFLIIYGTINSEIMIMKLFAIMSVSILLLSALYILKLLHEVFFGPFPDKFKNIQDISILEFVVLGSVVSIIILLGCCPFIIINFLN